MPTHDLAQTLTWQGRTIAWDRFGDGPPLVLLHGTPWSQYLWRPYAEAFASRFTVHLWDMPGYGLSSKDPAHAVDLGFQSEVFAHLLQEWGLERPHIIAPRLRRHRRPPRQAPAWGAVRIALPHRRGGIAALGITVLPPRARTRRRPPATPAGRSPWCRRGLHPQRFP
jgi:pimeloyl-ACP methyl ester carboxylesterase